MAIVFGSDIGIEPTSFQSIWQKIKGDAENAVNNFKTAWDTGRIPGPPKEKVYVDGGWENVPGTAFLGSSVDSVDDAKERSITSQEPILTVYIKKRAFWSLRSENNTKYLDKGEKLFLRATKLLFEKKCNQIGSYEALTKANRLLSENATIDDNLVEQVIGYLEDGMEQYQEGLADDTQRALDDITLSGGDFIEVLNVAQTELEWANSIVENLRELQRRNNLLKHETRTSWVVEPNDSDLFSVGRGSGVIELTLVTNLKTNLNLDGIDTGSINFTIEDPYNLTKITSDDIESALSSASAEIRSIERAARLGVSNNDLANLYRGPKYYLDLATEKEEKLRRLRDGGGENLGFSPTNAKTLVDSVSGLNTVLKKPEIVFQVNPTSSYAQNTVTGSIAGIDEEFTKNNFAIVLFQQLPVEHQPSSEEMNLILGIFDALESYISQSQSINTAHREANSNPDTVHARKNLRKHYLGKSIVQPMDAVHIYIRGNTIKDGTMMGPLGTILGSSNFVRKFENDESASQATIEEEMNLLGLHDLNINQDLYKSLRTSGMLRNAGMHVFGGLIKSVTESYNASSGTYTTSVSGESNMRWLDLSRVNATPSLDQTQGLLEDPLTPYDIKTDEVTGLIKSRSFNSATRERLQEINFDKSSEISGEKLDGIPGGNSVQNVDEETNGIIEKLKYPQGMVFKWKDGIIVATRDVNLRTPLDGSDDSTDKFRRDMGLTIVGNPFAGQDAANIVSLLVTGFPHNYESFYESALSIGTFNNNPSSNNPQSYFESFFDITRSTNLALGRFEPAKIINKDPRTAEKYKNDQIYLRTESKEINRLRLQLAEFQGRLAQLTQTSLVGDDTGEISKDQERLKKSIKSIIEGLKGQITAKTKAFDQKSNQVGADVGMKFSGDDRAFEFVTNDSAEESRKQNIVAHRIRNSMLQIRSQYDCKFNRDKNTFMIGDEYDRDLDLQAYAIDAIGSQEIDLWDSEYKTPKEICVEVSKVLDFEFFCMTKDTVILTKSLCGNITSKHIENFAHGDQVLSVDTNTGNISWENARVLKRKLNKSECIYKIRDGQGNSFCLSNKHRLLDENLKEVVVEDISVGSKLGMVDYLPNIQKDITIEISSAFRSHKWYKDLGNKFSIGGQDSKCNSVPKSVKLDEDISWMIGMYIAKGSISDPENRMDEILRGYQTIFSLRHDEIEIANKIQKIIKNKFNIESNIYCYEKYGRCTVVVSSFVFTSLFKDIFGKTSPHTKKLPDIIWQSTNDNKLACIGGILVGNGTYDRRLTITSSSKFLLNDISQVLLMAGIKSKIDKYDKLYIYGKENILKISNYTFGWKYKDEIRKYCCNDNKMKNRKVISENAVKSIDRIEYNDYVYDLEVDKNHTFVLGQTLSHNCDTQGHINFRPPRYNKIPLSLLLKMLLLEQKQGVKLYPDSLGALFNRRQSKAAEDVEILNLEIEIQTILLGGSWSAEKEASNIDKAVISAKNSTDLDINPESPTSGIVGDLVPKLIDARAELSGKIGGSKPNPDDEATKKDAERELESLNNPSVPNMYVKRLNALNKLSQMISRRALLRETEKKLEAQGKKFNETGVDYLTKPNEEILAAYEDLIEDDFNDLLGPGSSKRYIIYDDQIINSNFTESDNEVMVRIDVTGQQDLIGDRPGSIGGVPILWAGATDFDLWRQYGYRFDGSVNKPFLKNAETQCAPYAMMLLSRARRNTVVGSVIIYGNEYYQLGDVVYINSRDMLYYVTAVIHNFSYGNTFTTELELRYGHSLGDYILTPLDVMGKTIIKRNKEANKSVAVKKVSKELGVPVGVIKFDSFPKYTIDDSPEDKTRKETIGMLSGDFAYVNVDSLKDALRLANPHIGTSSKDSYPKIEIRGFLIDDSDEDLVKERMGVVKKWLQNPHGRYVKNTDSFIKISDHRYLNISFEPGQISDNDEPVLLTQSEFSSSEVSRLPSIDVFNLRDKDGRVDNVIEMVMIYEEIKDDE